MSKVGNRKGIKDQEGLKIDVKLVKSEENKADVITRIPKKWLLTPLYVNTVGYLDVTESEVQKIHDICHFGE